MHKFKGRYGLSSRDVNNLYSRYSNLNRRDGGHEFESFDAFVLWCSLNDYQPGMRLYRHNIRRHHSESNSYWAHPDSIKQRDDDKAKKAERERQLNASPFCAVCQRFCPNTQNGCPDWRKYFVRNWDRNISRRKKPADSGNAWRYEHPDLIREGIV